MLQKTRGIILRQIKYSDSSLIVHVYTEKHGRLSLIIKGLKSPKKKQKSVLLQALYLADFEYYYKPKTELHVVKEFAVSEPLKTIPYSVQKRAIAIFLCEVLEKTLKEEEPNQNLFDFLFHSVQFLDSIENNVSNFHLVFIIQYSRFLGFYPEDNYSPANPYFDMQKGSFASRPIDFSLCLMPEYSIIFHHLLNLKMRTEDFSVPLNHQIRNFLLTKILLYFRYHLESLGEIKSLEVFREVFE